MSRATPLFVLASLAVAAGCTDQPTPTAPTRPNAIVSTYPSPTGYAVVVDSAVILEGFPGSNFNGAIAVNSLGDAAGISNLGGVQHAVRWPGGSSSPIDVGMGSPRDINTAGQIAGEFGLYAALWTPNGAGGYTLTNIGQQLPPAVFSTASGMNASGQVVGSYRVMTSDTTWADKCFVWTPETPNASTGTATTLPDLGGHFCVATDINSAGYVVGTSNIPADTASHGFVWTPPSYGRRGKIQDLTPGLDGLSSAMSINEARQIAGQTGASAAIWTPMFPGGWLRTDIGTFTGVSATAVDINDDGVVVGTASGANPDQNAAFIWQNGEFTALPGPTSSTTAYALTGLNGKSLQVVGTSYNVATGVLSAVRWPVSAVAVPTPMP